MSTGAKIALLIGANSFSIRPNETEPYQKEIPECDEMLSVYYDVLINQQGFNPNNIEIIKDTRLKGVLIINHLLRCAHALQDGDEMFIYINTHGVKLENGKYRLCMYHHQDLFLANTLYFLFKGFRKGVKINFLSDVCNSGNILDIPDDNIPLADAFKAGIKQLYANEDTQFQDWLSDLLDAYETAPFSASIRHLASVDFFTEAHPRTFCYMFDDIFKTYDGTVAYCDMLNDMNQQYDEVKWGQVFEACTQAIKQKYSTVKITTGNTQIRDILDAHQFTFYGLNARIDFEQTMWSKFEDSIKDIDQYLTDVITDIEASDLDHMDQDYFIKMVNFIVNFYKIKIFKMPVLAIYGPESKDEVLSENYF